MDTRPFHNHGDLVCSKEKHDAIRKGLNPHKIGYKVLPNGKAELIDPAAAFEAMMRYSIEYTRILPDGIYCACCKTKYEEAK